jgi:hypothetical protein
MPIQHAVSPIAGSTLCGPCGLPHWRYFPFWSSLDGPCPPGIVPLAWQIRRTATRVHRQIRDGSLHGAHAGDRQIMPAIPRLASQADDARLARQKMEMATAGSRFTASRCFGKPPMVELARASASGAFYRARSGVLSPQAAPTRTSLGSMAADPATGM